MIRHLFISPAHNYFGHHGKQPDAHSIVQVPKVECVAGSGLRGDRFFDYREDYSGQVTFFAMEVYENLCRQLQVFDKSPGVFRRNVVTEGIDLNALIGTVFEIQGVRFQGMTECSPCYWMDRAFAPGAETALKGQGGLRAGILTSGWLEAD